MQVHGQLPQLPVPAALAQVDRRPLRELSNTTGPPPLLDILVIDWFFSVTPKPPHHHHHHHLQKMGENTEIKRLRTKKESFTFIFILRMTHTQEHM